MRTPMLACRYQTRNVLAADHTRYETFRIQDPPETRNELLRHVAWRVQGQLNHLLQQTSWEEHVADVLVAAALELSKAAAIVRGDVTEELLY